MIGGEIFVPKIPSFKITDLAKAINDKMKHKLTWNKARRKNP